MTFAQAVPNIRGVWRTDTMRISTIRFEQIRNYLLESCLPEIREARENQLQYVQTSIKRKLLHAVLVKAEQPAALQNFFLPTILYQELRAFLSDLCRWYDDVAAE